MAGHYIHDFAPREGVALSMRDFFGDLVCECSSLEFERIALTTPDSVMQVTYVRVTCIRCMTSFSAEADPHVEDYEGAFATP